jgi:hypothetical protein
MGRFLKTTRRQCPHPGQLFLQANPSPTATRIPGDLHLVSMNNARVYGSLPSGLHHHILHGICVAYTRGKATVSNMVPKHDLHAANACNNRNDGLGNNLSPLTGRPQPIMP